MARAPTDTRFRRFMMQAIMWLILGATIGAAALVDHIKQQNLYVLLDQPTSFGDFSVRLPAGWKQVDDSGSALVATALVDQDLGDEIILMRARVPVTGKLIGKVQVGDFTGNLLISTREDEGQSETQLMVTRPMPGARPLVIMLLTDGPPRKSELQGQIDLITRIAASVRVHSPDDSQT
jgi:hypothetical protein